MALPLQTRKQVELIEVGEEWMTASGKVTFTQEHLVATIAAMDDPAVRTPILKLGHTGALADSTPSFGRIENLCLSEDGMTLLGDYVSIPAWLNAALPSAYPRRSVEGFKNFKTATGNTHDFVLTAVALLGAQYPAITTLEDIREVFTAERIEDVPMVAASSGDGEPIIATKVEEAMPKPTPIAASMPVDDIRREYYDSLDSAQSWWWIRAIYLDPNELIVDDDEGSLYRVGFTIDGETVTFDDPVEVKIQYVDKSSEPIAAKAGQETAVYTSKGESRPATFSVNTQEAQLTAEQLKKLGLPEDATEEQINARIDALAAAGATEALTGAGESDSEAESEVDAPKGETESDDSAETNKDAEAQVASETVTASLPDGVVVIDAGKLKALEVAASRGAEIWEKERVRQRDEFISAAIKVGKIPPAREAHWRAQWEADPQGAKQTIDMLAEGTIPLTEIGYGDDSSVNASAEEYPKQFLTPAERANIDQARGVAQ